MVRKYKAGEAFVEVTPVFGDSQRSIANHFRRALQDPKTFEGLDRAISDQFEKAFKNASPEVRREAEHMMHGVKDSMVKEAREGRTASVKELRKLRDGYDIEMRKMAESIEKHIGPNAFAPANKEMTAYQKRVRDSARRIREEFDRDGKTRMSVYRKETEALKQNLGELNRLSNGNVKYRRAVKASEDAITDFNTSLKKLKESPVSSVLAEDAKAAEKARKDLEATNRQRAKDTASANKKDADLAAARQAHIEETDRRAERADERHRAAMVRNVERANRALNNENARQDKVDEARARRRAADARASYQDAFKAAQEQYQAPGADAIKGNRRQEAILARQRKLIEDVNGEATKLSATLSSIDGKKLYIDTEKARRDIGLLRGDIAVLDDAAEHIDLNIDPSNAERDINRIKAQFAAELSKLKIDVDVESEDAREKLTALRADLATLSKQNIEINAEDGRAKESFAELRAGIARLKEAANNIDVHVGDEDAKASIDRLRVALNSLRDKRVGIDISHRDAVANIEIVKRELETLHNKHIKIDVDKSGPGLVGINRELVSFDTHARAADRSAGRLARSMRNAQISFADTTQAFRVFNPIMAGIAFAGAPAITTIASLTAVAGGLLSILPSLAGGVSAVGFALGGLGQGFKAYQGLAEASNKASAGVAAGAGSAGKAVDGTAKAIKRAAIDAKYALQDAKDNFSDRMEDIRSSAADTTADIKSSFRDSTDDIKLNFRQAQADIKNTFDMAVQTARQARAAADEATRARFGNQAADAKNSYEAKRAAQLQKVSALEDEISQKRNAASAPYQPRIQAAQDTGAAKAKAIRDSYQAHIDAARTEQQRVQLAKQRDAKLLEQQKETDKALKNLRDQQKIAEDKAVTDAQKRLQTQRDALAKIESDYAEKVKKINRDRATALEKNADREATAIEKAAKRRKVAEDKAQREADEKEAKAKREYDQRMARAKREEDQQIARAERDYARQKEQIKRQQEEAVEQAKAADSFSSSAGKVAGGTSGMAEAQRKWNEEMARLGPEGVAFIKFLDESKGKIEELQRRARKGFLPGLQSGLSTILNTYSKPFGDFLEDMGFELGGIAKHWGEILSSPPAAAWFGRIGQDAKDYSGLFAKAIENYGVGIANLVDVFRPFAHDIANWLVDSGARFKDWTAGLASDPKFDAFMDAVKDTLPRLGDLAKNIGKFFVNATIGIKPFSDKVIDAVNAALDFTNALDPKLLGSILGAIGGVVGGVMLLSGVMGPMGAVSKIVAAAFKNPKVGLVAGLSSFVAISSGATAAMQGLGSDTGKLSGAMDGLGDMIIGANDLFKDAGGLLVDLYKAVEPLLPAIVELGTDIGKIATGTAKAGIEVLDGFVKYIVTPLTKGLGALPNSVVAAGLAFGGFLLMRGKITDFGKSLSDAWKAGEGLMGSVKNKGRFIRDFGTDLGLANQAATYSPTPLGKLKTEMGKVEGATTRSGRAFKALKNSMSGIDKASLIIVAIYGSVKLLQKGFDALDAKAPKATVDDFTAALKGMGAGTKEASKALDSFFQADKWQDKRINSIFDAGTGRVNDLNSAVGRLKKNGMSEVFSEWFTGWGLWGKTTLDKVQDQFKEMDKSLGEMASSGDYERAANGFKQIADAAEAQDVPMKDVMQNFEDYKGKLQNTARELGNVKLTEEEYYKWMQGEVPPAIQKAVEAQGRQKDGLAGIKTEGEGAANAIKGLIDQNNVLNGEFMDAEQSQIAYRDKMREIKDAIKDSNGSMKEGTKNGDKMRGMLLDLAKQGEQNLETAKKQHKSEKELNKIYRDQFWDLVNVAEQMGMNGDDALDYAKKLYKVPKNIKTKADLEKWLADQKLGSFNKDLDKTDKKRPKPKMDVDDNDARKKSNKFVEWLKNLKPVMWIIAKFKEDRDSKGHVEGGIAGGQNVPDFYKNRGKKNARGNLLIPMADGGLTPMAPLAQMVQPNTWRVVGDRMDVEEAYIPIDGSRRSLDLLRETISRMPNLDAMAQGGIRYFAGGAVAKPAAGAADAKGSDDKKDKKDDPAANMSDLAKLLGDAWTGLLKLVLGSTTDYFKNMISATDTWIKDMSSKLTTFYSDRQKATTDSLALLSQHNSDYRGAQLKAESDYIGTSYRRYNTFLNTDLPNIYRDGLSNVKGKWKDAHDSMASRGDSFRRNELSDTGTFLSKMTSKFSGFATDVSGTWSDLWIGLRKTASAQFGKVPGIVSRIMSDVNKALNSALVDPYNKVVGDLSLDKKLKIPAFPVQKKATGGHLKFSTGGTMPGYTPGRDVHHFFSPTGGYLSLSGGEPVLRPEVGQVVGKNWVDGANSAARNGGVQGVRKFLSQDFATGGHIKLPHQAFASGGVMKKPEDDDNAAISAKVRDAQNFARHYAGKPYLWGQAGPNGADCSGFMSILANYLLGKRPPWGRRFDTASLVHSKNGYGGFKPYKPGVAESAFVIGAYNHGGGGHTAGTLGGLNVESTGGKVRVGRNASGAFAKRFDHHYYLPAAGGKFIGSVGGGGGDGDAGLYDIESSMTGWLSDAQNKMGKGRIQELSAGIAGKIFPALAKAKASQFIDATAASGGYGGNYNTGPYEDLVRGLRTAGGNNIQKWRPFVTAALKYSGIGSGKADEDRWLRQIDTESDGNPRLVQSSAVDDINVKRGDPARGLVQVPGVTWTDFGRGMGPFKWNVYKPFENLVVGMRAAAFQHRNHHEHNLKGWRSMVGWGHGYDQGGMIDFLGGMPAELPISGQVTPRNLQPLLRDRGGAVPRGYSVIQNNLGHEETILPATPKQVEKLLAERNDVSSNTDQSVVFNNAQFNTDPMQTAAAIERHRRVAAIQRPVKI